MSEVAVHVVSGAPRIVWDDLGRPLFEHVCSQGLRTRARLPLGPDHWIGNITLNSVNPSLHCTRCDTRGFWTFGQWRPA